MKECFICKKSSFDDNNIQVNVCLKCFVEDFLKLVLEDPPRSVKEATSIYELLLKKIGEFK